MKRMSFCNVQEVRILQWKRIASMKGKCFHSECKTHSYWLISSSKCAIQLNEFFCNLKRNRQTISGFPKKFLFWCPFIEIFIIENSQLSVVDGTQWEWDSTVYVFPWLCLFVYQQQLKVIHVFIVFSSILASDPCFNRLFTHRHT